METKFTKGEWKDIIVSNADGWFHRVISIGGESVCNIITRNTKRAQANAKLIAAAPEMFNALVELLAQVKQFTDGNIGEQDYFRDEISNAKKAIKKATE